MQVPGPPERKDEVCPATLVSADRSADRSSPICAAGASLKPQDTRLFAWCLPRWTVAREVATDLLLLVLGCFAAWYVMARTWSSGEPIRDLAASPFLVLMVISIDSLKRILAALTAPSGVRLGPEAIELDTRKGTRVISWSDVQGIGRRRSTISIWVPDRVRLEFLHGEAMAIEFVRLVAEQAGLEAMSSGPAQFVRGQYPGRNEMLSQRRTIRRLPPVEGETADTSSS